MIFAVTEDQAAAIRAAFEQGGEFSAAVELHRLFPAITDGAGARECALMSQDSRRRCLGLIRRGHYARGGSDAAMPSTGSAPGATTRTRRRW